MDMIVGRIKVSIIEEIFFSMSSLISENTSWKHFESSNEM